jgi:hypothetical protein
MADVRRIVTISPVTGTVTSLVDFEGANFASERDTFTVSPPAVTPIQSQAQRQYGGSRTVGQIHGNGSISLVLLVTGSSFDNAMLNVSSTLQILLTPRTDLFFEWRPQGVTNSVYYQITGPPAYSSTYSWIQWQGTKRLPIKLEIPVAPLARGPVVTYTGTATLPEVIQLPNIPGDAPALVDVSLTASGGNAPIWALFGWWKKPLPFNMVTNGGFQSNTTGWSITGLTHNAQPTSITRITSTGQSGSTSAQVVSPATANTGPEYTVTRPFRAGQQYTVKAYIHANSGSDTVQLIVGQAGAGHFATSAATATSTTWTQITCTWTPDVDMSYAVIGIRHVAASAFTWEFDSVRMFEGTVDPALGTDGMGGTAPVGILQAEYASVATTYALDSNSVYLNNFAMTTPTASGAGSAALNWQVDPSVITQDDFASGTVDIEVYARMRVTGMQAPTAVASISTGNGFGAPTYTNEYGAAGKTFTNFIGTNSFFGPAIVRLGTLTMTVDPYTPTMWLLQVALSWGASSVSASSTIDYVMMVPARARALSKTGVAPDSYYPKFIGTTSSVQKTIFGRDLSGAIGVAGTNLGRDSGLGGSLIEVPPGNVEMLLKLSSAVADDPSSSVNEVTLTHNTTWTAKVTPRYFLAKGA